VCGTPRHHIMSSHSCSLLKGLGIPAQQASRVFFSSLLFTWIRGFAGLGQAQNSKTAPQRTSPARTRWSKDIVSSQSESANVWFGTCLQRMQKEPRDGVRWPLRSAAEQRVPFVTFARAPGDCSYQQACFTVVTAPLMRCAEDSVVGAYINTPQHPCFSFFLFWQWSGLETATPSLLMLSLHIQGAGTLAECAEEACAGGGGQWRRLEDAR